VNTAQRVLSGYTAQQTTQTVVPWIVGGVVVVLALWFISRV
jgi:hypothetical protein